MSIRKGQISIKSHTLNVERRTAIAAIIDNRSFHIVKYLFLSLFMGLLNSFSARPNPVREGLNLYIR
jgi:hypothetical protein